MRQEEASMRSYREFITVLYENIGELFRVNLLFILFSLPAFTLPASYTAMAFLMQKMVRGEVRFLWDDFFGCFKKNLFRSMPVGILCIGLPLMSLYVIPYYRGGLAISPLYYLPLAFCFIVVFTVTVMGFYAFPMLAALDIPLSAVLKNALALTFIRLWKNLGVLLILAVITLLVIICLPVSLLVIIVFYFSLACAIATYCGWSGILDYVIRIE